MGHCKENSVERSLGTNFSVSTISAVRRSISSPANKFFFFLNNNLQSSLQKNKNLKKGKEIVDYHDGFPLHVQQQGIIIPLRPMLYILEK